MKKRKKKSIIFVQECPPYGHEMLVCAGAKLDEVIKFSHDFVKRGEWRAWAKEMSDLFNEVSEGKQRGYAVYDKENGYLMLILTSFEDTWKYWECLIHELNHIIFWIGRRKMIDDEMEAQAYLQEYLFRSIRRKLMGIDPV